MAQAERARARPIAGDADALEIEEITAPDALEALGGEWRALFAADPDAGPFQAPEWLLAWRRAFLTGGGLYVLAGRRQGGLVGVAPFFLHRDPADGERQLTLLGNGHSDRLDLVARADAREAFAAAVARRLRQRTDLWDRVDFRDLSEGSPLLTVQLGGARELIEPEEPCPGLDLPADPAAVLAALPKSRRLDLRRCARRLGEIAPLAFTRADAGSLAEHLDALIALHGARWRERGQDGVLAEAAVVGFHRDAATGLLARDLLRLEALRLGGRIIAVHYGLRRGETGYSYLHAFDPELHAFGPGWLLIARSLEAAAREGVRRFDFLRGREPYKYAWGGVDQPQWRRRAWR
jgi:CelD/BcsL family acetyltransferase involved in cellulose biosynthesis